MIPAPRRIVLGIAVVDIYDGLVRILVDMQRFGWRLDEVSAVSDAETGGEITLAATPPGPVAFEWIAERLARHPSVEAVRALGFGSDAELVSLKAEGNYERSAGSLDRSEKLLPIHSTK